MAVDYIPQSDPFLSDWIRNFSGRISAAGAYGLMASDAVAITAAVSLYDAARQLAAEPATRTKGTVADKNAKKAAMLVTLRQYAQTIKRNLGVTNQAKIDLGLHINDDGPTPVPAPATVPVLAVASDSPLVQAVEFRDENTPDRRAKPEGVTGLMLAVAVAAPGAAAPTPDATPVRAIATRQPYRMAFDAADKGKVAFYYGRWITGSGKVGPWSTVTQLSIAG